MFTIQRGNGSPITLRVSSVYADGGIKTITVVRFGANFQVDSINAVISPVEIDNTEYLNTIGANSYSTASKVPEISEFGLVVKNNWISAGYFYDDTYAGDIVAYFEESTQ